MTNHANDNHASDPTSQECEIVLERVYEFLDNELDEASGDAIRQHLVDCEPCLDRFDVEQAVKALVNRCCGGDRAPEHLRAKVLTQLSAARESNG
ncbi:MAG TPA: mycothiol system anti-sigma-R factor [Propionibacteriaceae bacterium]